MRLAVDAVIIQERKLLLVRKGNHWILPGGKPEAGENDLECLCREIGEELSGTKIREVEFYKEFEGITPHIGDQLLARVYFAKIEGQLYQVRQGDSICEVSWATDPLKYMLSDITSKIVDSLKRDGYFY